MLAHRFQIEVDRNASQQIGQRNLPNLLQNDPSRDQFRHGGNGAEGDPRLLANGHQPQHLGGRCRWNSNQNFVNPLRGYKLSELLYRPEYGNSHHSQALFQRIVIDAANYPVASFSLPVFVVAPIAAATLASHFTPGLTNNGLRRMARPH